MKITCSISEQINDAPSVGYVCVRAQKTYEISVVETRRCDQNIQKQEHQHMRNSNLSMGLIELFCNCLLQMLRDPVLIKVDILQHPRLSLHISW